MTRLRSSADLQDEQKPPEGPKHQARGPILAVGVTVAVVAAVPLAQLGSKALYVSGCVIAVAVALYAIWDLVSPHLTEAMGRIRPTPSELPPRGAAASMAVVMAAALAAAAAAFVLARSTGKVLYALIGVAGLVLSLWLLWPLVLMLFDTAPDARPDRSLGRRARSQADWESMGLGSRPRQDRRQRRAATSAVVVLCAFAAAVVAFAAAKMGSKALLVLVGLAIVGGCLARARDKTLFTIFGTVCSLAFLVHKTFGPLDLTLAGGAPSVYISSFDTMVLLLYGLWLWEGTLWSDVRRAFSNRIMWVPLIGAVLMLPSLLAQGSSGWLGSAELARMAWMYMLFVYVAARVRSRKMVWAVLGGLTAFASVEIVVVLLQWKTGGVLGLSFLGVPTHLTQRITDSSQLGRPFGTIIHSDFMGATMGAIGLLSLAVALNIRRSLLKALSLALTGGCVVCLYLAHTRSALVAWVVVFLTTIGISILTRRLKWSSVGKVVLVGMIGTIVFFPQLEAHYKANFGTGHFSEEVHSRYQLNDVAFAMFEANPSIGVGLNSFQNDMGPYEEAGVIFRHNPVQNLYLLYMSETGILGTAGLVLVGVAMFAAAVRLARSRDRLMGGIGLGVAAAMAFFGIEELMDFALRQDVPLALYWLLAGLVVACGQMAVPPYTRRSDLGKLLQGDEPSVAVPMSNADHPLRGEPGLGNGKTP